MNIIRFNLTPLITILFKQIIVIVEMQWYFWGAGVMEG